MSKREQIEALAKTDVFVRAWLDVHRYNGGYTYEQVLEEMVIALAGSRKHLEQLAIDAESRAMPLGIVRLGS